MPAGDAVRWDKRYREDENFQSSKPRDLVVNFWPLIPLGGLVLDVAMGLGENTRFLIDKGYKVVGFDISSVAILKAKQKTPECIALIADSSDLVFTENTFDAILVFYYLDRKFLTGCDASLKKGGILFLETPIFDPENKQDAVPREYLMEKNEIINTFPRWDILYRCRCEIPSASFGRKIIEKWVMRKK
jgi:tellurite methyltransferase